MSAADDDRIADILARRRAPSRLTIAAIAAGVYLLVMVGISSWQTATIHYLEQRLDRVQSSGATS